MPSSTSIEPQSLSVRIRPACLRSLSSPPGCHPTQVARAQLGDTRGAVYLPVYDPPSVSRSISTSISIFGPSRPASPASYPAVPLRSDVKDQSDPTLLQRKRSLECVTSLPVIRVSVDKPSMASSEHYSIEQNLPHHLSGTSRYRHGVGRRTLSDHKDDGELDRLGDNYQKREGFYGVRSGKSETRNRTSSIDGTVDEEFHRKESFDDNTSNVLSFLDPFSGQLAFDDRRLSSSSTGSTYLRPDAFPGHRDTFARLRPSTIFSSRDVDIGVLQPISEALNETTHRNRMTILSRPATTTSYALRLPTEVVQHVFQYLDPCDFDAARHSCRSWLIASLDHSLSRKMMKVAGCYTAFLADVQQYRQLPHAEQRSRIQDGTVRQGDDSGRAFEDFSEVWLASKRLATECRLSAAWYGSGLSSDSGHTPSRLTTTRNVNFTCLSNENEVAKFRRFTVSSCGAFLIVTVSTDIFVYLVGAGEKVMKPIVRLVAGREVLKVSMDTSCGSYTIAALLNDRVGVCWDIQETISVDERSGPPFSIPIMAKPTHVYKNVGSVNDDPRCVAVCPQRQCVAFGCRTGVELYWTDVATGRSLNRWFPLAAPSDYLYFLRPRPDVDSEKKLRLISSAAEPSELVVGRHNSNPIQFKYSLSSSLHRRRESMTSLFFGSLPYPSASGSPAVVQGPNANDTREDEGVMRTVDCDHFQAVPLSDGAHMLYTEPETGLLCIGSNAPLGGPTKLVRKACMNPPESDRAKIGSLKCYAAGQDLRWGVRVVAAYSDGSLVLYNIPKDCFERIRYLRSTLDVWDELTGVVGQSDLLMDALLATRDDASVHSFSTSDTPVSGSPTSFRSLQILGAYVGKVNPNIEDLQVDCGSGGLCVWVFQHSGQATKMDIFAPQNYQPAQFEVGTDGTLREVENSYRQEVTNDPSESNKPVHDGHGLSKNDAGYRVKFLGLDGASDFDDSYSRCNASTYTTELALLEELNSQSIAWFPDPVTGEHTRMRDDQHSGRLQLEVLTDWRDTVLLAPYLINLD